MRLRSGTKTAATTAATQANGASSSSSGGDGGLFDNWRSGAHLADRTDHGHVDTIKAVYYEGDAPNERMARATYASGGTMHYLGKWGHERRARWTSGCGKVHLLYVGERGKERIYMKHDTIEQERRYYEGPAGQERLVRMENLEYARFYEGEKGKEHIVRQLRHYDGMVAFLAGETPGEERFLRSIGVRGKECFYEGSHGEERHVQTNLEDNGEKQFLDGPRGKERLVRIERASGTKQFFAGACDEERKVRAVLSEYGSRLRFRGPPGEEKLLWRKWYDPKASKFVEECALKPGSSVWSRDVRRTRVGKGPDARCEVHFAEGRFEYADEDDDERLIAHVHSNGRRTEFEGAAGQERKMRTWFSEHLAPARVVLLPKSAEAQNSLPVRGRHWLVWVGPRGRERVAWVNMSHGDRWKYEGDRGQERIVEWWNAAALRTTYYKGARGEERMVSAFHTVDRRVDHFEGEPGLERLVRSVWPDGEPDGPSDEYAPVTTFYHGPPGRERAAWTLHASSGRMEYFAGERDQERKVVQTMPDGTATYFEGARGQERPMGPVSGAPTGVAPGRAPPPPQVAAMKRKLGQAFEFLEGLSAANQCNEHVYNEMSKQLRHVYCACDESS